MQIIVKLTTACNLNCVYCSEGNKPIAQLPLETFFTLVDKVPELLGFIKDKNIEFLWHGGEPLTVGKEYLVKAMDYAKSKLLGYDVQFLMQSNGTLVDEEWIEIFKKYSVGVGVSLDGYKELHDANRRTHDGMPTHDLILKNIEAMRAAGLSVGSLMVLNTEKLPDIDKLYSFIKENDLHCKIHCVVPCGRASGRNDVNNIYANYTVIMKELYKRCMEDNSSVVIEPLDDIMNAIVGVEQLKECSYNGCCGERFMCIYPDGAVGFCGRSTEASENLIYGNVKESSLKDLYFSQAAETIRGRQTYLREHDCKNCSIWEFCHGGCSFEAVNATGNIYSKYANCAARKEFIHYFQTEGLQLLKEKLIRDKKRYRMMIRTKQELLEELDALGK